MVSIQFVTYGEIESLSSVGRIRKLLDIAKQDKIVLLQGRLRREEEAEMIKVTMEEINKSFKGIELAVIQPDEEMQSGLRKLKYGLMNILLGDRSGFTLIGPASVVKKIKQDPNQIEVLTKQSRKKPAKRRH